MFKLVIQPPALTDLEDAYLWIQERAPQAADRWFNRIVAALESLRQSPERCGIAPENPYFEQEVRQLLVGKRSGVYRVLFTIAENEVHILHIRRGGRKFLEPGDL